MKGYGNIGLMSRALSVVTRNKGYSQSLPDELVYTDKLPSAMGAIGYIKDVKIVSGLLMSSSPERRTTGKQKKITL